MNNKFSENIKKIRKDNHLSQEELAEQLGVSRQAISKWESSVAYPEMDKIIQICDKFGVNIDDLLHKDIKEVKGEEETKNKLDKYINDFFGFITDTVRLFESMSFKSKCKCFFEQCIIAVILFFIFGFAFSVLGAAIFYNIFYALLPRKLYYILSSIVSGVYIIFAVASSVIIMVHIFNIRYLKYYKSMKEDSKKLTVEDDNRIVPKVEDEKKDTNNLSMNEQNKIIFKKNKEKIVIRDPNHSEYHFLNGLMKLMLLGVKFCVVWVELGLCFSLVCIIGAAVASFLIAKTGLVFIGIFMGLISLGILNTVFVLLLFNFIFNRKSNKKIMIWSSILSIIVIGISCGLIALGSVSFDVEPYQNDETVTKSLEISMDNKLYLDDYMDMNRVEYIEENRSDLRIEYDTYEEYELNYYINGYGNLHIWAENRTPMKLIRKVIDDINNKKIIAYRTYPYSSKIRVYASKENIEKLKENQKTHYDLEKQREEDIERYEREEAYYEEKLEEAYDKIESLENKIDDYKQLLEEYRNNEY